MPPPMEMSRTSLPIEQWIAEARAGSRSAGDHLFAACLSCLLAAANRGLSATLRRRLDPGDVVQDTLMEAWQDFPHFRGKSEADLLAWLRQILRHNLANERRRHIHSARRSTRREVALGAVASAQMQNDGDTNTQSPAEGIEHRERREALEFSLRRLPEHYRLALCLHTQEGLTFIEVGGRLRCSPGAARKLWGRAAEELARLLGDAWNS